MQRGTLPTLARVEFHVPRRPDLPPIVAAGDLYLAGSEGWWCGLGAGLRAGAVGGDVRLDIERISAVTLKVASMTNSVRFYRDVLGMQIIYGGEDDCFSSFRTKEGAGPILNLEQGRSVSDWGRLIFHVADVDAIWAYLREKGFHPESPQDAPWGERYFHMPDPDGHELSFARPLRPPKV
jgi:catechol 2,3-dioxygenase-like lactoylglutathione lyase family enzyme